MLPYSFNACAQRTSFLLCFFGSHRWIHNVHICRCYLFIVFDIVYLLLIFQLIIFFYFYFTLFWCGYSLKCIYVWLQEPFNAEKKIHHPSLFNKNGFLIYNVWEDVKKKGLRRVQWGCSISPQVSSIRITFIFKILFIFKKEINQSFFLFVDFNVVN